jgi:4'-phosphopantetheinyl transferase
MNVFWLEQANDDVPAENHWLTSKELHRMQEMRFWQRRRDWRLGRWTAKCAIADYLQWPREPDILTHIELRTAPCGAPEVAINDRPASFVISLSHRTGIAMCSIAPNGVLLGCDLEKVELRSPAFISDYFTAEEQSLLADRPAPDQLLLVALLWSAKESALKALKIGLRASTHSAVVMPEEPSSTGNSPGHFCEPQADSAAHANGSPWHSLRVRCVQDGVFHGWWNRTGELLRTIVSAPPMQQPLCLTSSRLALSEAKLKPWFH